MSALLLGKTGAQSRPGTAAMLYPPPGSRLLDLPSQGETADNRHERLSPLRRLTPIRPSVGGRCRACSRGMGNAVLQFFSNPLISKGCEMACFTPNPLKTNE